MDWSCPLVSPPTVVQSLVNNILWDTFHHFDLLWLDDIHFLQFHAHMPIESAMSSSTSRKTAFIWKQSSVFDQCTLSMTTCTQPTAFWFWLILPSLTIERRKIMGLAAVSSVITATSLHLSARSPYLRSQSPGHCGMWVRARRSSSGSPLLPSSFIPPKRISIWWRSSDVSVGNVHNTPPRTRTPPLCTLFSPPCFWNPGTFYLWYF